ncbi:MAG: thioredoxin family protein [Flavipsychrobacter sp.]|nr:thioredoxin family protein [Flavipsychrobacter sp.]
MKNIFTVLAFSIAAIGTTYAQGHKVQQLQIGETLPLQQVNMPSATNGKTITLGTSATAKGLLVMFSCNTCPYVIKSQPRTKEIMKYAAEKGVGMVIINSNEAQSEDVDSYKEMEKYAKKQGYTVPYVMDVHAQVADVFGATHTPEVYLFDANKKLVYKGAMEDNPSEPASSTKMYLKDAINSMLAQKSIDPDKTKSIGCSIKRS